MCCARQVKKQEAPDGTWMCPDCANHMYSCRICGVMGPLGVPEGKGRRRGSNGYAHSEGAGAGQDDDDASGSGSDDDAEKSDGEGCELTTASHCTHACVVNTAVFPVACRVEDIESGKGKVKSPSSGDQLHTKVSSARSGGNADADEGSVDKVRDSDEHAVASSSEDSGPEVKPTPRTTRKSAVAAASEVKRTPMTRGAAGKSKEDAEVVPVYKCMMGNCGMFYHLDCVLAHPQTRPSSHKYRSYVHWAVSEAAV
jgi:hypothetical protein